VEADSCVGVVSGFGVGEAWKILVGTSVALATGGIAVDTAPFFGAAAAFGAQAARVRVSTNTALMRNLVFILLTPFGHDIGILHKLLRQADRNWIWYLEKLETQNDPERIRVIANQIF
jgi:hypothetical protein